MGRKRDIASFVNSIVGEEPEPQPLPKETAAELQITPEMEEALNAVRKANTGRPRKNEERQRNPTNERRTTFILDIDLVRKIKYISLADARLLKDVVGEAFADYIEKWENENGTITLPKARRND